MEPGSIIFVFIFNLPLVIGLIASLILWVFFIRPYLEREQGYSANGADWGYSMLLDMASSWKIAKSKDDKMPWQVKLFAFVLIGEIIWPFLVLTILILLSSI